MQVVAVEEDLHFQVVAQQGLEDQAVPVEEVMDLLARQVPVVAAMVRSTQAAVEVVQTVAQVHHHHTRHLLYFLEVLEVREWLYLQYRLRHIQDQLLAQIYQLLHLHPE
jgi:hypothetical protein